MNYVSHMYIAEAVDRSLGPEFALGAMLPDLASRAGTDFDPAALPAPVEWGARLHDCADFIFNKAPIFVDLQEETREELVSVLSREVARVCAPTSVEIMLDGFLLDENQVICDYIATLTWLKANYKRVGAAGVEPAVMTGFLDDFAYHGVPAHLKTPRGAAHDLHQLLNGRAANGFEASLIPAVAEVLADQQPRVREQAPALLASVLAGIRSS